MFGENAVQVKKPFETFAVRFVIIGLALNAVVLVLLSTGVIQRPGNNANRTQPIPLPDYIRTQNTTSNVSTETHSSRAN